jgi:hypothetical protein
MQKLIRHLQDQKCPPAVLEKVARRISRQSSSVRPSRSLLAGAISIACILIAISLWQWNVRRETQLLAAQRAAQAEAERTLVAQQTQEAFSYIGGAFFRAASHTQNALLKEAVPPLRNSFETVKNKVTNPI